MGEELPRRVKISSGRDDLEKVASMAAEKTAAMISRGLLEEIKRMREAIERLEGEISDLRSIIEKSQSTRIGRSRGVLNDSIREELEGKGFIIVSEASRKYRASPDLIVDVGVKSGALVLTAGVDAILISRSSLEEFKIILSSIKSSDPREAMEAAGGYARVFDILSKSGMVYYDGRLKGWVMVE